jgi:hypothetical protein
LKRVRDYDKFLNWTIKQVMLSQPTPVSKSNKIKFRIYLELFFQIFWEKLESENLKFRIKITIK